VPAGAAGLFLERFGFGPGRGPKLVNAVHLTVLWAFVFPQPVLEELDPQFYLLRDAGRLDIVFVALAVTFIPPVAMIVAEALARRASPAAAGALHLVFVGVLVTALAAQIVLRSVDVSSLAQGVIALAGGAAGLAAYAAAAPVRSLVTVLAPAPLLFLAVHLLTAPISHLTLRGEENPRTYDVGARAPVVMVLFDEFSPTALMNSRGDLDAVRFPNFARLAAKSTWFRNATTAHDFTDFAVPAILSGKRSSADTVASVVDHPENLFTLLGRSHRFEVSEPYTDLCPPSLCPGSREPFFGRVSTLVSDLTLVSLNLTLPDALALRLPRIEDSVQIDAAKQFSDFLRSIQRGERTSLHFVHVALPHYGYIWLPSGKRYPSSLEYSAGSTAPGSWIDTWGGDGWLVAQHYQRYLLQVGFVDRLVGKLIDRLKETGIYDRALLVVAADHGVSFRPRGRRRNVTRENVADIMPIPLFVKVPSQRRGRVAEDHVMTIDILPTVAAALGAPLPWDADGRSALASGGIERRQVTIDSFEGGKLSIGPRTLDRLRNAALARQVRLFGDGDKDAIYAAGPRADLLGRPAPTDSGSQDAAVVRIDEGEELAGFHRPSRTFVANRIVGRLVGGGFREGMDLAVALNGRIRATTRTYRSVSGEVTFTAMVPPSTIRRGRNALQVLSISGKGSAARLAPLGP
jgi:hypothetical protein